MRRGRPCARTRPRGRAFPRLHLAAGARAFEQLRRNCACKRSSETKREKARIGAGILARAPANSPTRLEELLGASPLRVNE